VAETSAFKVEMGIEKVEIHTAEPPVAETSAFKVDMGIEKVEIHTVEPSVAETSAFKVDMGIEKVEIHTVEPPVAETSAFKVEMGIEKVKGHISQGTDQTPAEMIKAVGRTICSEIHKLSNLILFGIRRNCLSRSRLLYLSIRRAIE